MALTYTQVTAITHNLIKDKMTEGVFTGNAFLKRLRMNQELEEGGLQIFCPLMTADDTSTTGDFYQRADALSLDEYDGISASVHDWKYIYESVVIYKTDIAKNGGRLGVLKLIDKKVRQAELAMAQRMVKAALSDGTVATGALSANQFVGLQAILASSGTYGGISSTDLSTWVSYVDDNEGNDRTLTKTIVDKAFDQAHEPGQGGPSVGLIDKTGFTQLKGLVTAQQRVLRDQGYSTLDGYGHEGTELVYNGIPHIVENQMPADTLFYVDEEHFKLHVHQDNNMRRQSIKDLETADALLERIFLYGNVVASERKYHSRVNDISD